MEYREKNKLYKTKLDWDTTEIEPKINNFIHDTTSDILEIFLIYLFVIDTIDELLTLDPMYLLKYYQEIG